MLMMFLTNPMLKFLFKKIKSVLVISFYLNFVKKVNCIPTITNSNFRNTVNTRKFGLTHYREYALVG